jgi:hypothetical protein
MYMDGEAAIWFVLKVKGRLWTYNLADTAHQLQN